MTSHPAAPGAKTPLEIHFVNFLQPTSGFCSFRLPAKWIQFFLIICMVCAGVCGWAHAHIEFVLSIKESWLLATIARPHPRPTVSQVADAFTHTSLPLLPPPPTAHCPCHAPRPASCHFRTFLAKSSSSLNPALGVLQSTGLHSHSHSQSQSQSNLKCKSKSTRLRDID